MMHYKNRTDEKIKFISDEYLKCTGMRLYGWMVNYKNKI
jgi:hypothetical protein